MKARAWISRSAFRKQAFRRLLAVMTRTGIYRNDYDDSDLDDPFFPFYVAASATARRRAYCGRLAEAGSVDAAESSYGRNNRFDFTIRDGILYSQEGTGALGVDDVFFDRVREPFQADDRDRYRSGWANADQSERDALAGCHVHREAVSGGNFIVNAMTRAKDAVVSASEGVRKYVFSLVTIALAAI